MALLTLRINTNNSDVFISPSTLSTAQNLQNLFRSCADGGRPVSVSMTALVTPVAAAGTVSLEAGVATGSVAAVINGVSIAVTYATNVTLSAAAMAAAINASTNPLVLGFVTATSSVGVVTITAGSYASNISGNAITLAATGTGCTASVARLAGGTNGTLTSFTF